MNIDPRADFAGIPMLMARDLVRALELNTGGSFDHDLFIANYSGPDELAEPVLAELISSGLIRPLTTSDTAWEWLRLSDREHPHWTVTDTGRRLASASAARPLRRTTAEKARASFLDRVDDVEADPRCVVVVAEVILFGSLLDPGRDRVSDVDLLVETQWCNDRVHALGLDPKQADVMSYWQDAQGVTPAPGKPLFARAVQQRLKGRSRAIQPMWDRKHTWIRQKGALPPHRILYRRHHGRLT